MKKVSVLKFNLDNVMNRSLFILIVFLQLFISCNKSSEGSDDIDVDTKNECLIVDDRILADQLKSNPENVVINGNRYTLYSYLWRDFMPVVESNGTPLMCVVRIIGDNERTILHDATSLSKIYVVYGHQVWISDKFEVHIFQDNKWDVVIRNGPKWGPNVVVDVICEFNNIGKSYTLISKSQKINAVY